MIVAHSRLDLAHGCVESLRAWLPRDRIAVVLNVPEAVESAAIAALECEAAVISPPARQGYGANLNFGVAALDPSLHFCVLANDDVVFEAESLPRLVDILRRDPSIGVVGPRLVYPDGREATSFAPFPTLSEAIRRTAILPRPLWIAEQRRLDAAAVGRENAIFVVGAAMVVRRSSFQAIGGFDEDFFLNWEEADLCFRMGRAGWSVAWCPDATVTHVQGASISRELNFAAFYASLRLYFRKRLGPIRWPLFELLLIAVFGVSVLYSALATLLRPRSMRHRFGLVRELWRIRVFLRGSRPSVKRLTG